ncbi:hypothetical protein TrVFT333_009719 [Trichoderma virens FT-333]|nr:hypothetical protein TrVFT333_009719 [Trichoderma virens FT-333]
MAQPACPKLCSPLPPTQKQQKQRRPGLPVSLRPRKRGRVRARYSPVSGRGRGSCLCRFGEAEAGPGAGSARQEWDAEAEFGLQNKIGVEHEGKNASAGSASAALRHQQVQLGPPFWWGPGPVDRAFSPWREALSRALGYLRQKDFMDQMAATAVLGHCAAPVTAPVTVCSMEEGA